MKIVIEKKKKKKRVIIVKNFSKLPEERKNVKNCERSEEKKRNRKRRAHAGAKQIYSPCVFMHINVM